jgi:cytochrome P450
VRRLANVAFTPRRVAAMELFVRELSARFVEERLSSGRADLIRDLAWDLPALVIFRVLGIPDEDVVRVKAGAESRLLLMWWRLEEDEQVRLAQAMAAFWRYAESLVASRAELPRDDFTSDLLLARDGDLPALDHQEVTTIVYALLFAGHETTTGLIGNAVRRLLAERDAWNVEGDMPRPLAHPERDRRGAALRLIGHRLAPQDDPGGRDRRCARAGRREPAPVARLSEP